MLAVPVAKRRLVLPRIFCLSLKYVLHNSVSAYGLCLCVL